MRFTKGILSFRNCLKWTGTALFSLSWLLSAAQINIDSINAILSHSKTPIERIGLLNGLAAHYNSDQTNQAIVFSNEAYLLSLKENSKKGQIRSLLNLSEGYLYNDGYDQALQYGYTALDICQTLGDSLLLADCYTNLGWIFYDTENADFAMQYHRMANSLYGAIGETKKVATSLNAIGLIFQMKNDYDSAKSFFENALKIAVSNNQKSLVAAANNNIGICENALGRYDSAMDHFNRALSTSGDADAPLSKAETLNQLAYSQLMKKDYKDAQASLDRSMVLIEGASSNTKKEKLLDNLHISAQLNQALGNYREAFEDLRQYKEISNQIISRAKSDAIASLKLKRETQEKENQLRQLAIQKELRAFQRNALAVLALFLVIIGFLLYNRLKQRQKKEMQLGEMKQALIRQELENVSLEKKALTSKLEFKNTELKNYALFISQRNEMMRSFIAGLAELKLENEMSRESLARFNKMISKINHDLEINKEVHDFNLSVDEAHKDFFYNLLEKYPGLTENERRVCAQIRLNLSIKDIASLNNISVKSAEMSRYRLRKHFGLSHDENLNAFLQQF